MGALRRPCGTVLAVSVFASRMGMDYPANSPERGQAPTGVASLDLLSGCGGPLLELRGGEQLDRPVWISEEDGQRRVGSL